MKYDILTQQASVYEERIFDNYTGTISIGNVKSAKSDSIV